MNELLELAIDAHGGLERWNQLKSVRASMSITGAIYHLKGKPDVLKDVAIEAELHKQTLVMHYRDQQRRTMFEPDLIVSETAQGQLLERRENPRASFEGHVFETPWDDVDLAYFVSEALWTYFTIPFLYTYPGFIMEELAPWEENREVWRPLKVTFPDSVPSHTREQISYFGKDGLLRRHEFTIDILGGAPGLLYPSNYQGFDGIMVPVKRLGYAYDAEKRRVPVPVLAAIEVSEVSFSQR
jgi:hypothetical protein